jgi:hypothetical protein
MTVLGITINVYHGAQRCLSQETGKVKAQLESSEYQVSLIYFFCNIGDSKAVYMNS